mgnify:CR=1 FL=1
MEKSNHHEKHNSNKKYRRKRHKTICSHHSGNRFISQSNKTNNIITSTFEKQLSIKKESHSNNVSISNSNYKKDLFEKFSQFMNKKKFKLCNNFDARNSKKFLSKKDKCLERIVLSDKIENEEDEKLRKFGTLEDKRKNKFKTENNIHKYFIVISNYDEEKKSKNNSKKKKNKLNKTKTTSKQKDD